METIREKRDNFIKKESKRIAKTLERNEIKYCYIDSQINIRLNDFKIFIVMESIHNADLGTIKSLSEFYSIKPYSSRHIGIEFTYEDETINEPFWAKLHKNHE